MEFIPDSLKLSGSLSVNNLDPESGYPTGWSGGIHAQEIYAEAKVGVGSKGELKISLNKDGDAYFAGKLGIGTTSPQGKLDVRGAILAGNSDVYFTEINHDHTGIGNTAGYAAIENAKNYDALMILGRAGTSKGRCVKLWDFLQVNGNMEITGNLGTHGYSPNPKTTGWGGGIHTWDIEAEGTIWSRNGCQSGPRDLAENYLSDLALEPGEVVCLDKKKDRIIRSEHPNDLFVLGVISTQPGFLLNADREVTEARAFPVALCGRVPCKVSAENGPIKRGDLLTTSSTSGHAMKAKPIKVNDLEFYRTGTIIGKALGTLEAAKGTIDIFLFLS